METLEILVVVCFCAVSLRMHSTRGAGIRTSMERFFSVPRLQYLLNKLKAGIIMRIIL